MLTELVRMNNAENGYDNHAVVAIKHNLLNPNPSIPKHPHPSTILPPFKINIRILHAVEPLAQDAAS